MQRFFSTLILLAVFFSIQAEIPEYSIDDAICWAYFITPEQEADFDADDGIITAFWNEISEQTHDYIALRPSTHSYPGRDNWENENDAQINIKIAYSYNGVYILQQVYDDTWSRPVEQGATNLNIDAVDWFFDKLSSAEIKAQEPDIYLAPNLYLGHGLTQSLRQLQVSIARQHSDSLNYNFYNQQYLDFQWNTFSFTQVRDLYGLLFENVIVAENRRDQEWFIPWSQWGVGGVDPQQFSDNLSAPTKLAFAGGYNDVDTLEGTSMNSLRWINGADPFAGYVQPTGCNAAIDPSCTVFYADCWGDIALGPKINGESRGGITAYKQVQRNPVFLKKADINPHVDDSYYSLLGRKIKISKNMQHIMPNGILLRDRVKHIVY